MPKIEWHIGPGDQEHPLEVHDDEDGNMLILWRDGQAPTPGMFELLDELTNHVICPEQRREPPTP